jgi:hypothetical protein
MLQIRRNVTNYTKCNKLDEMLQIMLENERNGGKWCGLKHLIATLGRNNRQSKGVILKQLCELSCRADPAPCYVLKLNILSGLTA